MSLFQKQNSKFWYYTFEINKKRYSKSTKQINKRSAQKVEDQAYEDALAEQSGLAKQICLSNAVQLYLNANSTKTKKSYSSIVSRCNKLLGKTHYYVNGQLITEIPPLCDDGTALDQITIFDVNNLINSRLSDNFKEQTIKHEIVVLKSIIKYAAKHNYKIPKLDWNKQEEIIVDNFKERFLTSEEIKLLLDELNPFRERKGLPKLENRTVQQQQELQDNYDFVVGLLNSGLRYDELAQLEWKNTDIKNGTITITRVKGKRNKINKACLTQSQMFLTILKRRRLSSSQHQKYVFTARDGKSARKHATSAIQKAIDRAGLNDNATDKTRVTPHTLRHTFGSHLAQSGEFTLHEIAEIGGWSSIKMLEERYAHLVPQEISKRSANVVDKRMFSHGCDDKSVDEES